MVMIDFARARSEISMAEVLCLIGWAAREARGPQLRGGCPVHGSGPNSRSFSVNLQLGRFKCFRADCAAQGDCLELYARVSSLPVFEATQELCIRLGRPVPWVEGNRKRNGSPARARPAAAEGPFPCIHCGTAFRLDPRQRLCGQCGHAPLLPLGECYCPACVHAAVPDLVEIADGPGPEGADVCTPGKGGAP